LRRSIVNLGDGNACMAERNERAELEMKIIKYRSLARQLADDEAALRVQALIAELERKLREMDE
jgi:hypothetical protein